MSTRPTLDDLLAELDEEISAAFQEGQLSAAVKATELKARLMGLLIERRVDEVIVHKPGFTREAIELTEDEWKAQFALPTGNTHSNDR